MSRMKRIRYHCIAFEKLDDNVTQKIYQESDTYQGCHKDLRKLFDFSNLLNHHLFLTTF